MRHAEAAPGDDDDSRALTAQGRSDASRMARLLSGCHWGMLHIRHSPLLRATQTAEIVAQTLSKLNGKAPQPETDSRLKPGADIEDYETIFYEDRAGGCNLWVFHSPEVMQVAAWLTGLRDSGFYFTPGSMLALNVPQPNPAGRAMVVWQAQPEYLRDVVSP